MVINIPPKHSVAQIIGYVKRKSAIAVARQFGGRQRNFNGENSGCADMRCRRLALKRRTFGNMFKRRNSSMVMPALTKTGNSNYR